MPIPDSQRAAIKEMFAIYDKDGDNLLDSTEIRPLMRSLGVHLAESEVKDLLVEQGELDKVSFNTVVNIIERYEHHLKDLDAYRIAFGIMDKENTGLVNANGILSTLAGIGQEFDVTKAQELVRRIQLFSTDSFNLQEFFVFMMNK
jgi:Ca2+-binding EF-hand superfamily protein